MLIRDIGAIQVLRNSRRSRIFLRRGPLSCEVPSRRDSVGGGGSSRNFRSSPEAVEIQGGGSRGDHTCYVYFNMLGPTYATRRLHVEFFLLKYILLQPLDPLAFS